MLEAGGDRVQRGAVNLQVAQRGDTWLEVGSCGSEQPVHCWGGRKSIREQRQQAAVWSCLFMVEMEEKMLSGKGNAVFQRSTFSAVSMMGYSEIQMICPLGSVPTTCTHEIRGNSHQMREQRCFEKRMKMAAVPTSLPRYDVWCQMSVFLKETEQG